MSGVHCQEYVFDFLVPGLTLPVMQGTERDITAELERNFRLLKKVLKEQTRLGVKERAIRLKIAELSQSFTAIDTPPAQGIQEAEGPRKKTRRSKDPGSQSARVCSALEASLGGLRIAEIAKAVFGSANEESLGKTRVVCSRLSRQGAVVRISQGFYAHPSARVISEAAKVELPPIDEECVTRVLELLRAQPRAGIYSVADTAFGASGPEQKQQARALLRTLTAQKRIRRTGGTYSVTDPVAPIATTMVETSPVAQHAQP